MTEREPEFALQDTIEFLLEAYAMREDAGQNEGAHYLTLYEYLRIELWDRGYRQSIPA